MSVRVTLQVAIIIMMMKGNSIFIKNLISFGLLFLFVFLSLLSEIVIVSFDNIFETLNLFQYILFKFKIVNFKGFIIKLYIGPIKIMPILIIFFLCSSNYYHF